MDNANGNNAWQSAVQLEDFNFGHYGRMQSFHAHDAFLDEVRQQYEEAFEEPLKPLDLVTWHRHLFRDDFNEFCSPEQVWTYRELLSHLQKVTFLGHYEFHRAVAHLNARRENPREIDLLLAKDLVRYIVTFPQAAMTTTCNQWSKPKKTRSQRNQAYMARTNLRVIRDVLRQITSSQELIEQWTQWGRYIPTTAQPSNATGSIIISNKEY